MRATCDSCGQEHHGAAATWCGRCGARLLEPDAPRAARRLPRLLVRAGLGLAGAGLIAAAGVAVAASDLGEPGIEEADIDLPTDTATPRDPATLVADRTGPACLVEDVRIDCVLATATLEQDEYASAGDGTIVVGGRSETVRGLDASTLEERWRVDSPDGLFLDGAIGGIVLVSIPSDTSHTRVLDVTDGSLLWEVDGQLFTGFQARDPDATPTFLFHLADGILAARDPLDGAVRWSLEDVDQSNLNPFFVTEDLLLVGDGETQRLIRTATGEVLRTTPAIDQENANIVHLDEETVVLVRFNAGDGDRFESFTLEAADTSTGTVRWNVEQSFLRSFPTVTADGVLVASDGDLRLLDLASGDAVWTVPFATDMTAELLRGATGVAVDLRLVVVGGGARGRTDYLDLDTGEVAWSHCGGTDSANGSYSVASSDGRVFQFGDRASIVDPSGERATIVLDGMAGGYLLRTDPVVLASDQSLYVLDLPDRPTTDLTTCTATITTGEPRAVAERVDHAIVSGDTLVVTSVDAVEGIPLVGGADAWRLLLDSQYSTAWSAGGRVGLRSSNDATAPMIVVDAATGRGRWESEVPVEPLDDTAVARILEDRVQVLDIGTGAVRFTLEVAARRVSAADGHVVVLTDGPVVVADLATGADVQRRNVEGTVTGATMAGEDLVVTTGGTSPVTVKVYDGVAGDVRWSVIGVAERVPTGVLVSATGTTSLHDVRTGEVVWAIDADAHRVVRPLGGPTRDGDALDVGPGVLVTYTFGDDGTVGSARDLATGAVTATWEGTSLQETVVPSGDRLLRASSRVSVRGVGGTFQVLDLVTGEILTQAPLPNRFVEVLGLDPLLLRTQDEVVRIDIDDRLRPNATAGRR